MNALDIIREAAKTWPVTFPNELKGQMDRDISYALSHRDGPIKDAIMARADGIKRGIEAIERGDFGIFIEDMNAGIVALCAACQMLGLSREVRMKASDETWGN